MSSKAWIVITLILTLCLLALCKDPPPYKGPSEEDVVQLDANNLEQMIYQSEDAWLVDLYAYWCDHCQKLRPQWAKLATKMKGIAKVAKIDASQNRQFDQLFALKGYPHVVMVPAGPKDKKVFYAHEGARTADSLYEWAMEKMKTNKGFMVERLTSESVWQEYCLDLENPLCIVIMLPSLLDSTAEERSVYLQIARGTVNNFRDKPVSFLWTQAGDHPEIQNQFNLQSGFPLVLLINPMRRVFSIMKSSYSEENLEEWLKDILNRKGGRKFGHYTKQLIWNQVQVEDKPVRATEEIEINEENFDAEL